MLVIPASHRMVITRLRRLAMIRGPLAVRTCERSSSKSMWTGVRLAHRRAAVGVVRQEMVVPQRDGLGRGGHGSACAGRGGGPGLGAVSASGEAWISPGWCGSAGQGGRGAG